MRIVIPAALAAVALMLAGCGKNEEAGPVADAGAEPAADTPDEASTPAMLEACKLTMTAPDTRQWTSMWDPAGRLLAGEGPSNAHSPYWSSAEERQQTREAERKLWLDLACSVPDENGDQIIGIVLAAPGASEKEIPFGPGSYRIVTKAEGVDVKPGDFVASWIIYDKSMFTDATGTFEITRFDSEGIAGSFDIKAQEPFGAKRPLALNATFDIPCRGGPGESACTADKTVARE